MIYNVKAIKDAEKELESLLKDDPELAKRTKAYLEGEEMAEKGKVIVKNVCFDDDILKRVDDVIEFVKNESKFPMKLSRSAFVMLALKKFLEDIENG